MDFRKPLPSMRRGGHLTIQVEKDQMKSAYVRPTAVKQTAEVLPTYPDNRYKMESTSFFGLKCVHLSDIWARRWPNHQDGTQSQEAFEARRQ
jgi:hypothetical protein